nr:signal peptidase II [Paracoccus sp. S-4012]
MTGLVAGGIILFDQLTKWFVVHWLDLATRREIDVIDPFLNFRMAWNQGVNFGLLSSSADIMRWVLVAVALAVCVWVGVWVHRARPGRMAQVAAGLLIGGAIGNVIDRVAYGAVADFLNMSLPGWRNPYSFNVADIAIFAGALGLVFQPQPAKPRDGAKKTR